MGEARIRREYTRFVDPVTREVSWAATVTAIRSGRHATQDGATFRGRYKKQLTPQVAQWIRDDHVSHILREEGE